MVIILILITVMITLMIMVMVMVMIIRITVIPIKTTTHEMVGAGLEIPFRMKAWSCFCVVSRATLAGEQQSIASNSRRGRS